MMTLAAARSIRLALALALLWASPAAAQIAIDATSNGGDNAGATSSLTWSHTTSGSNRFLVVGLTADYVPSDLVTGCTYNAVSMTETSMMGVTADRYVHLFVLHAPATGAHDVVCSASGTTYLSGGAVSYTGVETSGQPEATNTGTCDACTSLAVSVTTITASAWVIGVAKATTGMGPIVPTVTRVYESGNGLTLNDRDAAITPPGSTSIEVGFSSGNAAMIVASIAPVGGGGGGGTGTRSLLTGAGR